MLAIAYGQATITDLGPDPKKYSIDVFNVLDGGLAQRLEGHSGGVMNLSFSPEDNMLASAGSYGDGKLRLWHVSDGKLIAEQPVQEPSSWQRLTSKWKQVRAVNFSKDGRLIVFGGSDSVVYLVSAVDGRILKAFTGHSDMILGVAFSEDGQKVLSASADGAVKIWKID